MTKIMLEVDADALDIIIRNQLKTNIANLENDILRNKNIILNRMEDSELSNESNTWIEQDIIDGQHYLDAMKIVYEYYGGKLK